MAYPGVVTQKDELARVKNRIEALADKTIANGCTEAEGMSAGEMVGRLLKRHPCHGGRCS
jgi:hypothetical protein